VGEDSLQRYGWSLLSSISRTIPYTLPSPVLSLIHSHLSYSYTIGADPDGLSAVQPDIYRDRFLQKIEDILDLDLEGTRAV
jgi:hypothetical protein